MLILEGWGTTTQTYVPLINSISNYASVYCLDMPGFGMSEEPNTSYNLDDYVDFVIKFIESENIKELDLIGHSNGGRIIIKLMSRKNLNFKVNKIILIGSAGIVHKKPLKTTLKIKYYKAGKFLLSHAPIKTLFPSALESFQGKFGSPDYKSVSPILKQSMVKLINEDVKEYLPNIKSPTLLIWGENDTATPICDGELMEKIIPDAGLVKVKNCSHYVFLENPYLVNTVIENFLNERKS